MYYLGMDTPKPAESATHHLPADFSPEYCEAGRREAVAESIEAHVAQARNEATPIRALLDELRDGASPLDYQAVIDARLGLVGLLHSLEEIARRAGGLR